MKTTAFALLLLVLLVALAGCKPDLTVTNTQVTWDTTAKKARATIANVGTKDAGPFLVYFNADENPVSQNYRPQVTHNVTGLAKGESIVLQADFAGLARPENSYLRNVYRITVIADPKGMVDEANENNNEGEARLH